MNEFTKEELKILDYVSEKVIEKDKTCLQDQFDNGYFWAMKELQSLILKGDFHE
jgi:hypothetical protein